MKIKKVALSVLDTNDYEKFFEKFKKEKMEYLHFDVMDGQFVKSISLMDKFYLALAAKSPFKNDVHLMVKKPFECFKKFAHFKSDIVTAHFESFKNDKEVWKFIKLIRRKKKKVGLSIKPRTSIENLTPFLKDLDLVLVMSVEPGLGGQEFIATSMDKINYLFDQREKNKYSYLIEIDGGINDEIIKKIPNEKIDLFVMGSYFTKSSNLNNAVEVIKNV